MNRYIASTVAAVALFASAAGHAQVPAGAPTGTTALCSDGTYFAGASKKGACSGHKGVKAWYGAASAAPAPASSAMGASAAIGTAASVPASAMKSTTAASAKPAGGPGQVWVNAGTHVYHCPGDKYYGKTKQGSYMPEADAKAKGFHADHGKACQ